MNSTAKYSRPSVSRQRLATEHVTAVFVENELDDVSWTRVLGWVWISAWCASYKVKYKKYTGSRRPLRANNKLNFLGGFVQRLLGGS